MKRILFTGAWRVAPALLAGAVAMLFWAIPAGAQNLQLFEDVEQTAPAANRRGGRTGDSAAASLTEPEFVLVGASRIGDQRRVVLAHRSGETISVPMAGNGQATIPGHEQFRIITSEGSRVAIQYPAGSACVEAADRGVNCDDGANVAWLSLRPAPVQVVVDLNTESEGDIDAGVLIREEPLDDVVTDSNNPFARLRAEALGQDVPRQGRFRPRRIDPSEVPPGMRVVSTPFGDRVVEID